MYSCHLIYFLLSFRKETSSKQSCKVVLMSVFLRVFNRFTNFNVDEKTNLQKLRLSIMFHSHLEFCFTYRQFGPQQAVS